MNSFEYRCGVCLQPKEILQVLLETDSSNESWTLKLQFIVPEVEWLDTLKICTDCAQKTNEICQFRRMCIEVDKERQQLVLECQETADADNNCQSKDDPKCFSCSKCEQSFENQQNFDDHFLACIPESLLDEHQQIPSNDEDSDGDDNNCQSEEDHAILNSSDCENSSENKQDSDDHKSACQAESYTCFHCNAQFRIKTILAKHIRDEHKQAPDLLVPGKNKKFTCDKCRREYVHLKRFRKHLSKCDGAVKKRKARPECDICHKTYSTIYGLRDHRERCVLKSSGVRVFKKERKSKFELVCEICDKKIDFLQSMIEHCVKDHSMDPKTVKPYSCSDCGMRFSATTYLKEHKKYHEGSRTFICSYCGKSYITKKDMQEHELIHLNMRNYKCETCGKTFNTRHNLRGHNFVVHADRSRWKYVCSTCGQRFPYRAGMEVHMRRHTGDRRFSCQVCNKLFMTATDVKIHMNSHTSARPFKCEHCPKDFKKNRLFKMHLVKAHNIGDASILDTKKIICAVCAKAFDGHARLKEHMWVHTGVRPYECNVCGKKLARRYYLNQHLKAAHNVQPGEVAIDGECKDEGVGTIGSSSITVQA